MGARTGRYKWWTRAGKYKLGARVGKYKLCPGAGKHKLGARTGKYKHKEEHIFVNEHSFKFGIIVMVSKYFATDYASN